MGSGRFGRRGADTLGCISFPWLDLMLHRYSIVALILLFGTTVNGQPAVLPVQVESAQSRSTKPAETVFDLQALISTPLNARILRTSEEDGIVTEEVMFHSEMDGEK